MKKLILILTLAIFMVASFSCSSSRKVNKSETPFRKSTYKKSNKKNLGNPPQGKSKKSRYSDSEFY